VAVKQLPMDRGRVRAGGNLRWLMVFMAFLGTTINYVDRANLGVAVPFIQKELHITSALTGLALGAFFITYAIGQLPAGYLVDRIGARVMYTVAVVWWSVFTAATALARDFSSLYVVRLLLGLGEAGAYPSNAKVVSEWFPMRERAFATSIFDNGARFGTALSLPIVTLIVGTLGWRASFVITGALGIVWAAVWILVYRRPREHRLLKKEELAYIEQGARLKDAGRSDGPRIRWIDLFRYRTVWGMMLGFFCLNFVIYFFITWFPAYLVQARGFSLLKLGIFGTIPALVAIVGGWTGGLVADRLVRSGMDLTRARKICLVGGMLFASVIALAVLVPTAALALALLSICYASLTFAAASVWSLPADVAPTPRHVASIGGIQNFASNLAGVITAFFTGLVVQITGNYVVALVTAGLLALVGAFSYLFVVGPIEPLPELGGARTEVRTA
jgi:MFS transporter, ACS family, D-galactonate transporter